MRNFKMSQKRISIFTLLIMLCNFLMPQIMMVKADGVNAVLTNIYSIETKITNIDTFISNTKNDVSYESDLPLKVATNYFEYLFTEVKNNFVDTKEELGIIKLSDLIALCTDEIVKSNYIKYNEMNNTDLTIDIESLTDIKFYYNYLDGEGTPATMEITLLTVVEQESLINTKYLDSFHTKLETYTNETLQGYKTNYLSIIESIDNNITTINTMKSNIKAYEESELLLNNVPNMLVGGYNIYDLLDSHITEFNDLKEEVDLTNTDYINEQNTSIIGRANDEKNIFDINNGDFTTIGNEINALIAEYHLLNTSFNDYLTNYTLSKEQLLESSFANVIDNNFVLLTETANELNEKYFLLEEKINTYLERRPSDSVLANEKLNQLVTSIGTNTIEYFSNILETVFNNTDLSNEDKIDLLRQCTLLSEDTKEKLFNAKLTLNPISLKDSNNYTLTLNGEYFILDGAKELDLAELYTNILYGHNYQIDQVNGKNKIELHDKNDFKIVTYQILLKNDLNNDLKVDNVDLEQLKLLLNKEGLTNLEQYLSDINNDEVFSIKDVTDLENILNKSYIVSTTDNASFKIVSKEENNKIIYEVYLLTNGLVKGFEFNLNISNDLTLLSVVGLPSLIFDNDNPTKVYGLDSYQNDTLLLTLTYELNNEKSTKTTFNLLNGLVVYDNGNSIGSLEEKSIITRVIEEKEEETTVVKTTNIVEEKENATNPVVVTDEKVTEPEEKINWSNVIKVVVIVLLGVLIIYFLNKTDDEETRKPIENNKKTKKED